MRLFSKLFLTQLFLLGSSLVLVEQGIADDLFRDKVAPIFQNKCVGCHNDNDLDGELSLQSLSAMLKGGESGEAVVPGQPDAGTLLDWIGGTDPEMPKDAKPLSKGEVESIRQWIEAGAKWPKEFRLANRTAIDQNWWSLKPLKKSSPDFENQNPIDYFVSRRHALHKMSFAVEAEKRVLIRRLYYDLIGLAPTPAQIDEFVQSKDPFAYSKLVDQLLASPRYGEKWARHWLDVVQYGETHGYDKDKPRMNAWPYRDYVIRAFNEDRQYTRFVKEQLAGDVLYKSSQDGIVATGFIAAGPWDFIGHAEVPESKIDGQVARNLDRDNMVTSTMNTFCSLTVQCARCHNHKLDPVTMEEYYSLQAVFAAIDRADRDFDADPAMAEKRGQLQESIRSAEIRLQEIDQKIESVKTAVLIKLENQIKKLTSQLAQSAFPKPSLPKSNRMGYHSQVARKQSTEKWVQIELEESTDIESVILTGASEYGFEDFGFPHRFRVQVSGSAEFTNAQTVFDHRQADFARPGSLPVHLKFKRPIRAKFVRLTATKLWNRRHQGSPLSNDWIFAVGEMSVVSQSRIAPVRKVTALDSIEANPGWGKANLVDHIFGRNDLETKLGRKESPTNGYHSQFVDQSDSLKWVQVDLGAPKRIDEIRIHPAYPTDFQDTPGFGFPLRFKIEVSRDASFAKPTLVADQTRQDFPNPLTQAYVARVRSQVPYRFVRLTATRLWDRGDQGGRNHALAIGEMEVVADSKNIARNASVSVSDSIDSGRWHRKHLVDGHTSRLPINRGIQYLVEVGQSAQIRRELDAVQKQHRVLREQVIPAELLQRQKAEQTKIESAKRELAQLPKPSRVYAGTVHAGRGAFRGRAGLGPREIFVLHRGEVTRKRDRVSPGTVPFIANASPQFVLPENHEEGDRRVALADWITRSDNPLTWRSIVNRVWQYHFGQGIVESPNDFGRGGSLPTHPELLDWLAVEFRDGGKHLKRQSIKSLHRLICNSRTYKQTSRSNLFTKQDGGNRFLWRMNRRRLTAEEIHDTVLQATRLLNLKMGGPSYMDFVIQRPEHSPHYEYHLYDPNKPETHRRAVYRFIVRSQPQPFMDTLNCADPSFSVPRRAETLTALQALGMLNNRFMVAMAEQFKQRLKSESSELDKQVSLGYLLVTGRRPSSDEARLLVAYAREHGLHNLCRVFFNLNEFVFVD